MNKKQSTHHDLQKGDLILIVDPQMDFMLNGSLAVPEANQIIPIVNQWIAAGKKAGIPIAVSRDWHPPNHVSFEAQGGPWPVHCVRDTAGAAFHPDLQLPSDCFIVNKAFLADKESYSAFAGLLNDTGRPFTEKLDELGIKRIWIMGLALDYCVYNSAIDAAKYHLEFHVVLPACRAISEKWGKAALVHMKELGGVIIEEDAVA